MIAIPFIQEVDLTEKDQFCLLACDGDHLSLSFYCSLQWMAYLYMDRTVGCDHVRRGHRLHIEVSEEWQGTNRDLQPVGGGSFKKRKSRQHHGFVSSFFLHHQLMTNPPQESDPGICIQTQNSYTPLVLLFVRKTCSLPLVIFPESCFVHWEKKMVLPPACTFHSRRRICIRFEFFF